MSGLPEGARDHAPTMMTRSILDREYSPSLTAKDPNGVVNYCMDQTRVARSGHDHLADLRLPYGEAPRQYLDIYRAPACEPAPVHVFLHGGFWQELSTDYAGYAAPAFTRKGNLFVAVNYTLAPTARLDQIVAEVRAAYGWISRNIATYGGDPSRIVVSGHSAGAHLAASLIATTGASDDYTLDGLCGLVLISGVFDLEPIANCYVNEKLRLDCAETFRRSLPRHAPVGRVPVRLFVGADESEEFRRQSRDLRDAWAPYIPDLELTQLPDRDHFDIQRDLAQPDAELHRSAVELAETPRCFRRI